MSIGVVSTMGENEGKINILIVDDRPENLLALEAIIESDDYQLIKAFSGEEALKYLLKYDFAAILLDVQMPGMDGYGTAKIIKARQKTKNIPILFITANNMDAEHIFLGYSVGAIDYIMKPFNPLILKAKVEGFVELYKIRQQLVEQSEALLLKNKEIEYMAYHDTLTELPNRRSFHDKLIQSLDHSKRMNSTLAIMYLNMDRFKYVNDSLGHITGDRLLQQIAKRLSTLVRTSDLVARVGGDEFNILLPETDRETALEIAESIISSFEEPFLINNYELFLTVGIGLSVFPFDGEDSITLLKNADVALFRAKEQGKNKYKVYHSGMNIQSYRSFLMENDLRYAIERNQLSLVYQPRVNLETGKVTSAEALIRWNHHSWGLISPMDFIPLAEETGLIVEIGQWVLKTVCKQIQTWKNKGLTPVRIAINFSPQQFLQKDLVESIKTIIAETQLPPELLEIEITETVILGNEDIITQTLLKLRKMGIKISLDDFGTGYSSLHYLRRFPLDAIKIDRSFIQDIFNDGLDGKAIVQTIINLAENMGMSVVAEGVETEEQLNFVATTHCREVQGFIFSKPVEPSSFEGFLVNPQIYKSTIKSSGDIKSDRNSQQTITLTPDKDLRIEVLEAAINRAKDQYSISSREMDVFKLIITGLSNKEISDKLFISEHTVKNHITRILQKLQVTDRVQAMAKVYDTVIKEGETLLIQ
ncbi:EAL domain-containing protein [Fredinandcohnia sp. 179-A 10B2 NHS]